ncbi:hypothetical protein N658DRAFT_495638 [Parathielavia hyrcaniae]|uniref:Uncharacterized protein n=1 Tax=Parathielavia hyrcaniae TaxID=113614 RepID=A0AAN6Q298_9PEZI|nr:hypothetical protein N658DRAFT_495638 [Parathielavia hyrcaniae]
MLKSPWCTLHYNSTKHARLQDVILLDHTGPKPAWMQHAITTSRKTTTAPGNQNSTQTPPNPMVDHITCFGALHFLTPAEFDAVLARRSVMFDVDDLCPEYLDYALARHGEGFRNYNHVAACRRFGTPAGWTKVVEEETVLYHSPDVGVDVRGVLVRFERAE